MNLGSFNSTGFNFSKIDLVKKSSNSSSSTKSSSSSFLFSWACNAISLARSKYFNGSFNGILALNPYFFLDLDVVLTSFQPGDFLNFVTTIDIGILKRINGTFNINFPNIFKGKVALENGNIFLKIHVE